MLKGERPTFASIAILLMIGSGLGTLGVAVYFVVVGANLLGVLLVLMLGFVYAYGGWGLQKDESWGWGAGVFGGALYLLFGWLIHPIMFVFMAIAILVMALLFQVREYYGMVRPDPDEEERVKQDLRAKRMSNPGGFHCPRCGSTALWVADDGSAYCDSCKTGIISIRPTA